MSPVSFYCSFLVVSISLLTCRALPAPQPSISFARLGQQKDNLIRAAGGFKQELLSPIIGIKQGLVDAKLGLISPFVQLKSDLIKTKLGLTAGLAKGKVNLARRVLRPVVGLKRAKLQTLRDLLDAKIGLLDRV